MSSASVNTFSWLSFCSLVSRAIVRLQVSLGLPTLLLPVGVQLIACFGRVQGGMRRTCAYHFYRRLFITPIIDGTPVVLLSSSSLTWYVHLLFNIFLRHLLSNLLALFSTSFRRLHASHPYINTEMTFLLKSLSFVGSVTLSAL